MSVNSQLLGAQSKARFAPPTLCAPREQRRRTGTVGPGKPGGDWQGLLGRKELNYFGGESDEK